MKRFEYVITQPIGIDVHDANWLNKEARKHKSAIVVHYDGKSANVLRLMALLHLEVRYGKTVEVTITGEDEDVVAPIIEEFFKNNL